MTQREDTSTPHIRILEPSDRSWVASVVTTYFGSPTLVSRRRVHDALKLEGFIAQIEGKPVGLLLHRLEEGDCEVVVLVVLNRREGIGSALMGRARRFARERKCRRLWLITTNDNKAALAFYEDLGMRKVAVHKGAIKLSRLLKPEIPERSRDGTPIEDEIEFEFPLVDRSLG